ncbi:MAG: hypothetical protein VB817_00245, partial [Pirellulaceae bacterium]
MSRSCFLAIVLAVLCPVAMLFAEPVPEKPLLFESDIAPVLRIYCWHCHGGGELAAGLDLRSQPLILA